MRTVELAKIATAAEALHLRRVARRQAFRAAYGVGAAVFGIAVLTVLHFLIYVALTRWLSPLLSVAIVLVIDLLVAGALAFLAIKSPPDAVELEAKQIRTQALIELKRSLTVMGMAAEVAGLALRTGTKRGVRRGFGTVASELASRLLGR